MVILAVDVKINGEERFQGKPIVRVKTEVVIKSPVKFLESGGFTGARLRRSIMSDHKRQYGQEIKGHLLTGISWMIR